MIKIIILTLFTFNWIFAQEAPVPVAPSTKETATTTIPPVEEAVNLDELNQLVNDPNFGQAQTAAFDQELFNKLKIYPKMLPLEFELFFNLVYKYAENDFDKEYLVETSYKLATYFKTMTKDTRILLLKSEIVRNILEYRFDKFSSNLDINNFVIDKALQKIKKFKTDYDEASLFVINSCIGDLAKFYDEEILNNLKLIKANKLSFKEAKKVQEINSKLKYLRPWFYFFDKLSPGEFNDIIVELSFEMLKNIETKAFLMSYFAPAKANSDKVFELPEGLAYQTSLFKIIPQEEAPPAGDPLLDQNTQQMLEHLVVPPLQSPPEGTIQKIEQEAAPQYTPSGK